MITLLYRHLSRLIPYERKNVILFKSLLVNGFFKCNFVIKLKELKQLSKFCSVIYSNRKKKVYYNYNIDHTISKTVFI